MKSRVVVVLFLIVVLFALRGEKLNFSVTHPELLTGEVFITNANANEYDHVGWETKRPGIVSYDIYGKPLGERWPGSFPVFAQSRELEEAGIDIIAMKARMSAIP